MFSSFIIGFTQLEKEAHISSITQSLGYSFLHRALSSFARFFRQNIWAKLYHPKGAKGWAPFQTKTAMEKKVLQAIHPLLLVKPLLWPIVGIGLSNWLRLLESTVIIRL